MVDVGANIGIYTHVGRKYSARIHAVEPIPQLAASLRRLYRHDRVEVWQCALSDHEGKARLFVPVSGNRRIDSRASLIPDLSKTAKEEEIEIAIRTLDGLMLRQVGLIKIDVEGHEQEVLRGGIRLIERDHPTVIVEAEERMRAGVIPSVFWFFGQRGYDGFFILHDRLMRTGDFKASCHQDPALAKPIDGERAPGYVNNFIFVHQSRSGLVSQMQEVFPFAP
jgi:FkbM family methyltransferase